MPFKKKMKSTEEKKLSHRNWFVDMQLIIEYIYVLAINKNDIIFDH